MIVIAGVTITGVRSGLCRPRHVGMTVVVRHLRAGTVIATATGGIRGEIVTATVGNVTVSASEIRPVIAIVIGIATARAGIIMIVARLRVLIVTVSATRLETDRGTVIRRESEIVTANRHGSASSVRSSVPRVWIATLFTALARISSDLPAKRATMQIGVVAFLGRPAEAFLEIYGKRPRERPLFVLFAIRPVGVHLYRRTVCV